MQKQSLFGYYKKGFSDTFVQRESEKKKPNKNQTTQKALKHHDSCACACRLPLTCLTKRKKKQK